MLFRVLGPLSVERAGLALSALMVRRLLAALLCRPNECVAVEGLLLALWGENPPPGSRKTLRVYVRRLRSALSEARIVHEPAGYRLIVRAGELDSDEFVRLVSAARTAEPEQALALLSEAIKLWRGNAFEDVREYPPVADEARQLDEQLVLAETGHARLQLELGRHAELVPHLTKLVDVHPYREELRGYLMLALYRSGRQSEALEVYRNTRRLLDHELGIEPGPELQRLHESILRADSALEQSIPPNATVPRELPADIGSFVGRAEHLKALDEMLPEPTAPVVISAIAGSAGVGKTALAVHWAHAVADRFPDGQLFANLRGFDPAAPPVDPASVVRRFLDALGVPSQRIPSDLEAQATLYRSQLSGKKMLVLLDNAYDAEQVRPLLPGSADSLVIVTSRNRLASLVATNSARPLMLDVLTEPEARQLLAARLGQEQIAAESAAVDEIIARCVRLPLALAIAAARAATQPNLPLEALAAQLREERAFDSDDPLTHLSRVFSCSYQRLTSGAARLFRMLGLHPGPDTTISAAASLIAMPLPHARQLLSELVQAHLITEHAPGRYAFHDLLRAYAAEQTRAIDSDDDRRAAVRRLLDHYSHSAVAADRFLDAQRDPVELPAAQAGVILDEFADKDEAMTWFKAQHQVLLSTIRIADETQADTQVWLLVWAITTFVMRQGHWRDWAAIQMPAIEGARRLGNAAWQAYAWRSLGYANSTMGDYETALEKLAKALMLYREIEHQSGQAHVHHSIAMVYVRQDRPAEALEQAKLALVAYQAAGHRMGLASSLNTVGWYEAMLGQYDEALAHCHQALKLLVELDHIHGQAATWHSIGHIHQQMQQYEQAADSNEAALRLYRELGDLYYQGDTLERLGDARAAMGDHEKARAAWEQALAILTGLDHPQASQVAEKLSTIWR
ncbi:SARP family transcriptional regulator [Rhizocola hellebori]|uniref:SARP family transcriptional regulator n=1 Tax=Rhizocola hellebori TaxID=1392758 RepID=A0A8J3Q3J6_9ACTN|nr:BTAD domain-containing putative transcriptional regulator [Rhizocola hellebori]GIH02708.1 SARP family transcriptional regulator [Rhizocola hellebori]